MEPCRAWRYLGLEQKRLYQRNFLKSMFVVTMLVVLSVVVGGLLVAERPVVSDAAILLNSESSAYQGGSRWSDINGSVSEATHFSGGYIENLTILRDASYDVIVAVRPAADRPSPPSITHVGDLPAFDYSGGYGSGSGTGLGDGENDFGLPDERGLFPITYKITPPRLPDIRMNMNRDGIIRAGNIRWPGFPAKPTDTGFVVVDITIHKDASITYRFVSVDPPGKGFKVAAERAIVCDYDYEPRVVRGEPIETTVRLSLTICLDCQPEIRQMSGLEGFHVYIGE